MIVHKILRADSTELPNIKSCVYSERVNAEENVRPGCVASASIEVEVYGAQGAAVTGGEALTYYQVNGETETLIGTFYAEPNIDSRMSYRFKAYDAASKLDADFSARLDAIQGNFPMTLADIVSEAATVAGVSFDSLTFPMASTEVSAFYADGIACRQIVGWAAEIACCFVKCKDDGVLTFAWYAEREGYRIYPNAGTQDGETLVAYKANGLTYENYNVSVIDGVTVYPTDEEDELVTYPASPQGANILTIRNNLLLTDADPATLSAVAENVYTVMSALPSYAPFSASLFPSENPFHAGDIVNVTDVQGNSFQSIVMSMTVYPYRTLIGSTGKETYEEQTNSNTKKGLLNLASNILRLKSLFVESLEAVVARIDNLFAQEITVTGTLHSEDYNKDDKQTYAFDGMGIDFGNKEISATNFSLSKDGVISARTGTIGDFQFMDAGGGTNITVGKYIFKMLDNDGNESTNYSYSFQAYTYAKTVYPWQQSVWWYYKVNERGTLVYDVPYTNGTLDIYTRAGYIRYIAVTLAKSKAPQTSDIIPTISWYQDGLLLFESSLSYCDAANLIVPSIIFAPDFTVAISPSTVFEIRIDLNDGDECSLDVIYGGYTALYYGDGEYGGDGSYFGSEGVSAPKMSVNGKDVESLLVPAPASTDEGRILKVVNGVPTWVAP